MAIELCLTLGMVFHQPLRQTQGLMRSIAKLLVIVITVPDFLHLIAPGQRFGIANKAKGPRCRLDSSGRG
jgi:hypothetical protein